MLLYTYKHIVECIVHIGTWHFTLNYIVLHLFCSTIDRDINIKLLTILFMIRFLSTIFYFVKLLIRILKVKI